MLIHILIWFLITYFSICIHGIFLIAAEKDWDDIKFGVENKVDYYAVSFVKDADVVHELKGYLQSNCSPMPFFV